MNMKELKRIDTVSFTMVLTMMQAIFFVILAGLSALTYDMTSALAYLVMIPIMFIANLFSAILYNFVAKRIGGIKIELG